MDGSNFLSGQFLLAMPGMGDPRFDRAVIAMCAHNENGALGIGLGTTIKGLGLHALLTQLDIDPGEAPDSPVHRGGPCDPQRGFVIHSPEWSGQETVDVAGRWALSGTIDILRAIAEGRGPRSWVIALGYAGWGDGQLEGELVGPGWFSVGGQPALIFETEAPQRWTRGFADAGIDPRLLNAGVGTA